MNSARRRRSILSSATRFSPKAKSSTVQPHEQWLARAEDDLSFAQLGLREKYFSQVCFLSQQVVEKAFKAFLLAKGRSYPEHSIRCADFQRRAADRGSDDDPRPHD